MTLLSRSFSRLAAGAADSFPRCCWWSVRLFIIECHLRQVVIFHSFVYRVCDSTHSVVTGCSLLLPPARYSKYVLCYLLKFSPHRLHRMHRCGPLLQMSLVCIGHKHESDKMAKPVEMPSGRFAWAQGTEQWV